VGGLEDQREDETEDDHADGVHAEDLACRVESEGRPKASPRNTSLPTQKITSSLPRGTGTWVLPTQRFDTRLRKLTAQLPLQREQRIEDPDVDDLKAVVRVPPLEGRDAPEHPEADVVVLPDDVGVRVMGDVVLVVPEVRGPSQQIERQRHHPVHPGPARVGPVPAVVLHVEADAAIARPSETAPRTACHGALTAKLSARYEASSQAMMMAVLT
jgi:hypothetical protein